MRVCIVEDDDSAWLKGFEEKLSERIELKVVEETDDADQYEILVTGLPEREQIENHPELKSLIIPWAGVPGKTRQLMFDYPQISVHNLHHNAVPVAESAVALMISAARRIHQVDHCLRKGDWSPRYMPRLSFTMLTGRTAVILGYGQIGREIARRLKGLDMNVIGIKRTIEDDHDEYAQLYSQDRFREILPRAEVLIISLPLTDDTKKLIGESELKLLPPKAILVNIARGPIVVEEALFTALKERRICAGLDVWYEYPREADQRNNTFPGNLPFHELDNIIMTPHMAEHSDGTEELLRIHLATLLNEAAEGKPMSNRVDIVRGY